MTDGDRRYVRQSLAMALGAILMAPETDTKGEMVERLKRSMEKVDAALPQPHPMTQTVARAQQ